MSRSSLPLDGSDPLAAPGLMQVKDFLYWRAPRPDIRAGHSSSSVRLPGRAGDGQDAARAKLCRKLEADLIRWRAKLAKPAKSAKPTQRTLAHSWRWIMRRYLTDEFSPFSEVKANTQVSYRDELAYWDEAIGNVLVSATDYVAIKRLQRDMQAGGRSLSFIARKFTMLRIVANYGAAIAPKMFIDIRMILSTIRFKKPGPRDVFPTEAQVMAIINVCDDAGDPMMALGLALQWWLTLRARDVRGDWMGTGKDARWVDGLTWSMIKGDMAEIRKVVSKTAASDPREMVWDLSPLPDIQARLRAIPIDQRVGPVIRQPDGQPFHRNRFTEKFRKYRAVAGVHKDVKMMDTRAGAINHAKSLGATEVEMQLQAGHASSSTTQRYIRGREAEVNKVIKLRSGGAKEQG